MKRSKIRIIILFVCVIAVSAGVIIYNFKKDEKKGYISIAVASKMLALLDTDKSSVSEAANHFGNAGEGAWYEKYINYMLDMKYIILDEKKITKSDVDKAFTFGDLKQYLKNRDVSMDDVSKAVMVKINSQKNSRKLTREIFLRIYDYLVSLYGGEDGVHIEQLVVATTPANSVNADRWTAYTTNGARQFEGLSLDRYIDREVKVYVRKGEIVYIIGQTAEKVEYRNIWIEEAKDNRIKAFIGGDYREFYTGQIEAALEKTIADISVEDGRVVLISNKENSIDGKVLMSGAECIEIEGYNRLELDKDFKVYRTYGKFEQLTSSDIMVGYNNTRFVVGNGKICAALITSGIKADNIRVLVMSTGFTSIFHNRVSFTCDDDFTVSYGDKTDCHKAGDIVDLCTDSASLLSNRAIIRPVVPEGRIKILTVEKSYGNPSYRGTVEVAKYDEGLVIVNDIAIEKYLCAVVPSEMPNRFGVEALKVQAVCARSYAYRQLLNNAYAKYGAHVDDSVNYQVYNNVSEKEEASQAVKETYGEVASYNGETITTYYYSTSCGHTSDNSVWGGNPDNCPYLTSKTLNPSHVAVDLSSEDNFRAFIDETNTSDFDYGFGYYRWKVRLSLSEITKSVNEYLFQRYEANPDKIKVKINRNWISRPIRDIGAVKNISEIERCYSGAIKSMVIEGTLATIKIENELNVRYLLCPRDNPITLLKGDTITFYILPSAYCYFEPYDDADGFAGYEIRGGGYGHGIGMSQNAVSNMVKSGMHYDEILKYFFEGIEITDVYRN